MAEVRRHLCHLPLQLRSRLNSCRSPMRLSMSAGATWTSRPWVGGRRARFASKAPRIISRCHVRTSVRVHTALGSLKGRSARFVAPRSPIGSRCTSRECQVTGAVLTAMKHVGDPKHMRHDQLGATLASVCVPCLICEAVTHCAQVRVRVVAGYPRCRYYQISCFLLPATLLPLFRVILLQGRRERAHGQDEWRDTRNKIVCL